MREEHILNLKDPKQKVWDVLQQVPGLSEPSLLKICAILGIKRNAKFNTLNKDIILKLESLILRNFLVGYKLIRRMSATVTARFISRSRRGIRSRNGLPINGQRTHSNGKTPRRLRGHWVLPEVLKDPGAYYITQQNMNRISKTLTTLLHKTVQIPKIPINKRFNYHKQKKRKFIKKKK